MKADTKANSNIDELIILYKTCKDEKKKRMLHIRIIEPGMDLVKKIAAPLAFQALSPMEDLVQVGAVGLIKAVKFFEPDKNAKFYTYANYFIKGEIRHYIRDKAALIKTPRKLQEIMFKIYNARKEFKEAGNIDPTNTQIAQYINIPLEKVEEVMKVEQYKTMISLDQTISSDNEDISLLDKIPSGDYQEFWNSYEDKLMIESAIEKLPADLKEVLELSFYEELNQREISEKLNLSQMQVSRRLKKALNKMYEIIKRY